MTLKTINDCARCHYVASCDAHVTNGIHKHQKGPDPCERVPYAELNVVPFNSGK
jgi:hypothetical protein